MAKYDHGGGCGCGLYAECLPDCWWNENNPLGYYKEFLGLKKEGTKKMPKEPEIYTPSRLEPIALALESLTHAEMMTLATAVASKFLTTPLHAATMLLEVAKEIK